MTELRNDEPHRKRQIRAVTPTRGDLGDVAEILPTRDEAAGLCGFVPAVEVIEAEVAIELAAEGPESTQSGRSCCVRDFGR